MPPYAILRRHIFSHCYAIAAMPMPSALFTRRFRFSSPKMLIFRWWYFLADADARQMRCHECLFAAIFGHFTLLARFFLAGCFDYVLSFFIFFLHCHASFSSFFWYCQGFFQALVTHWDEAFFFFFDIFNFFFFLFDILCHYAWYYAAYIDILLPLLDIDWHYWCHACYIIAWLLLYDAIDGLLRHYAIYYYAIFSLPLLMLLHFYYAMPPLFSCRALLLFSRCFFHDAAFFVISCFFFAFDAVFSLLALIFAYRHDYHTLFRHYDDAATACWLYCYLLHFLNAALHEAITHTYTHLPLFFFHMLMLILPLIFLMPCHWYYCYFHYFALFHLRLSIYYIWLCLFTYFHWAIIDIIDTYLLISFSSLTLSFDWPFIYAIILHWAFILYFDISLYCWYWYWCHYWYIMTLLLLLFHIYSLHLPLFAIDISLYWCHAYTLHIFISLIDWCHWLYFFSWHWRLFLHFLILMPLIAISLRLILHVSPLTPAFCRHYACRVRVSRYCCTMLAAADICCCVISATALRWCLPLFRYFRMLPVFAIAATASSLPAFRRHLALWRACRGLRHCCLRHTAAADAAAVIFCHCYAACFS